MRLGAVFLIFRKDWLEVTRSWQVLLPVLVLPCAFAVMLPVIAVVPTFIIPGQASVEGLLRIMRSFPAHIIQELAGMTGRQAIIYLVTLYLFAPVFLTIPIMASSVIASDSFAGEKERKTIEALLATPLSNGEMLLGKMLVSFVPAFVATVASFMLYSAMVDYVTFNIFNGRFLLPNPLWLLLILGLAPALAFANIELTVIVSARVKGVREAQQVSSLFLIPLVAVVLGQASGVMALNPSLVAYLTALLILFDLGAFGFSIRAFGRDKIVSRLA